MADDFDRACAQVGRFMYHFAELENQIDAAIGKLFELEEIAAQAITGSVDFYKRFNLVRTYVLAQISEKDEKERAAEILNEVIKHNSGRQVVAHSRFEPAGDGVKFTRIVATEGKVTIPPETWPQDKFDRRYRQMQELSNQLQKIVAKLKPAKAYVLAAEFGGEGGLIAKADQRRAEDS
jgi:hypothetical protein